MESQNSSADIPNGKEQDKIKLDCPLEEITNNLEPSTKKINEDNLSSPDKPL